MLNIFSLQTEGPWSNIYWSGSEFSWDQKHPAIHYLFYELSNRTDDAARGRLDDFLRNLKTGDKTPNGFRFLQKWGSARHNMNSNFINLIDAINHEHDENIEYAFSQLDYILGRESGSAVNEEGKGMSLQIGFGEVFPTSPHHRSSSCFGNGTCLKKGSDPSPFTLFGALVGGPEELSDNFKNDRGNWISNEVALDYNAGFQGVLAARIQTFPPKSNRICNGKIIPTERPPIIETLAANFTAAETFIETQASTTQLLTTTTRTTTTETTTIPMKIPDASLNFQTITFVRKRFKHS